METTDLYQLQSEIEGLSIDNALLRAENIRLRWENKPKIEATAAGVETTEQEVARLRTTTQRLRDELLFVDLALTRLKEDIKAVGLDTESIRKVAAAIRGQMVSRDDIIRMAREAGDVETDSRGRETFSFDCYGLERFAALVTAAEREACALVAETYEPLCDTCPSGVANAIRARGEA